MTDEKLDENYSRTSVATITQPLPNAHVYPNGRMKLSARKRIVHEAFSSVLGFLLGFLLGGTEFPLQTYPLGCALVASLPRNLLAAMLGIIVRSVYLFLNGTDLLLPMICSAQTARLRFPWNTTKTASSPTRTFPT